MQEQAIVADAEPAGLRGWLVIVGIGIVFGPVRLAGDLYRFYGELLAPEMQALLKADSLLAGLVGFEVVGNLVLFLSSLVLAHKYLSCAQSFPRFFIVYSLAILAFIVIDAVLLAILFPGVGEVFDKETVTAILGAAISAAIWIPYMLLSRRVRNTFIH